MALHQTPFFIRTMAQTNLLNSALIFFCSTGLALSIYAYVVELKVENDSKYVAMCDISEHMSCTKAFKSQWGKGLGIFPEGSIFHRPNSLMGILFYSVIATLAQSNSLVIAKLSYWSMFLANLLSLYFAYILYFKLQDFCIVCVSTYFINIVSLILLNFKVRNLQGIEEARKKRR